MLNDFFVFDTETGIKKKRGRSIVIEWILRGRPENFVFGCVVGKNYRKEIHSVAEFKKEFLHPRYKNKKVFAHNAIYDLNLIFDNIFYLDPTTIMNGSRFICCTNGNCMFADSMNIYKMSAKKIGAMLGLKKLGMSGGAKYKKTKWHIESEKQKAIRGCFRDCEIIYEALFRKFEEAGDIKITMASLSMTNFRRFYQPYDINHNENTAFFFDSYFGGRTEAFKIGRTWASVQDVVSMYAYWMKHGIFPDPSKLQVTENVSIKKFLRYTLYSREGLVYADIEHHPTTFGFLPVKHDKKLKFPNGNFSGCWNFNELRFALERKAITIKKIKRVVSAPPMFSPFVQYVDNHFRNKNQATDKLAIQNAKDFLTNLYGKFAQRITEESIYIKDVRKEMKWIRDLQRKGLFVSLQPFNPERNDAWLTTKSMKNIDISFCIPSFASYITSYARVHLLKRMLELEKNNVVYCDTDSVFFEINNGVKSESQLGGWKTEKKIATEIQGLKQYKYIDPEKALFKKLPENTEFQRLKGVPENAKKIKSKNGKNSYIYENLIKTKEALRRNLEPGILIKRKKEISGKYEKRIILADGSTKPIVL